MLRSLFLLAVVCMASPCVAEPLEPVEYSVGVASVDITPAYPIRLNGFGGRSKESEGIRQQLWAKAIAIGSKDSETTVVITVDTLGIPDDLTDRVAEKLAAHGLDRRRLAICASHTHSGPMIRNCANTLFGQPIPDMQWQTILKYTEELERNLVEVAVAALKDRKAAHLSWGIGKVGFAMNRRTAGGPVDHDLPLLVVRRTDGTLRAIFTNYACHCVTLSDDMISGDWAGYAMDHIQRRNPGCEALISIGCGADSNPRGGVLGSNFGAADSLGQELAEEVQRLLTTELHPLSQQPSASLERIVLPLAPLPTRAQWEERAKNQNAIGHHARTQLARLDRGEKLMTEISYPVQTIAFGTELAWVFLPGEVVVDYALRLKKEQNGQHIWMNAYSNACPGYVPSERILKEGGYEGGSAMVYYDIPGPYAPGLEQSIVEAVRRQLKDSFAPAIDVSKTDGVRPLSPSEAVQSLRTKPGYRVEVVAAEPLIESPVAVSFAADGSLWVAEMSDYPQGKSEGEPGGQIRHVFDDNADGSYDRSEVFLTGIPFPTGVTVWRNGLLICAAPDILYAEDTNGDGKADDVRRLFTGFATHNYQARVNSLEYGLDGWLYGSCGLFGGDITSTKTGNVVSLGQRDFRFNPDTGAIEAATGATQQGRVRNDWGDWFGCNNSAPLMHYPLADEYLRRNPYLTSAQTVVGISAGPDHGRLFSISNQVLFMLSGPPNRPTAACGLGIYRDDLLGAVYSENAFTCEPVNNLVHRQILTPAGVTFTSRRDDDEQDREFLASTDPWFRPVQVRTGLDGGLWVVDMYRYVIEHPIWIPPATLATLDPRAGATMGRLYRVVSENHPARQAVRLDQLHGEQLAAAMDSANGTQRDLVQQLIQWNNETKSIPGLMKLCVASERPEVRIQSLSTLQNLNAAAFDVIVKLLGDKDARVRQHAVRIAESQLKDSTELATQIAALATDEDAFVRLQVAYVAGVLPPAMAAKTLADLLTSTEANPQIWSAAESSFSPTNVVSVFRELQSRKAGPEITDRVLRHVATLGDVDSLRSVLADLSAAVTTSKDATALLRMASFLDAWQRRSETGVDLSSAEMKSVWSPALNTAAGLAADKETPVPLRVAAIRLLALGPFLTEPQTELLAGMLTSRTAPELQMAVIAAMKKDGSVAVADAVLADWESREPRLRKDSIALLLSRRSWTERLLSAMKDGIVSPNELDLPQQQSLLENSNDAIRAAAALSFKPRTSAARQEAILRYTAAINENGDPAKGRQLFQKHCSNCHRIQDVGHVVGPDLLGYSGKPVQSLLIAMLDPNQAVDPRYQSYVVVLNDGRSITGIIAEEASASLTLMAAEAKRETVLRSEVDQIRSTGKSLMPEGFEQNATPEDVNHLWAFFRTLRQPPKSLEGNVPAVVDVPSQGNVALMAAQAEIYGGDITFEVPFQNIGYWHGQDDLVRWRLNSETTREVVIWAEWACDDSAAGSSFVIEGVQPALKGMVGPTGDWSRFQLVNLGKTLIREGESELLIRPDGRPKTALADLRALHLVTVGGVPLATGMVAQSKPGNKKPQTDGEIAAWLIDDANPAADREAVIAAQLKQAGDIIPLMAQGLPADSGSKEEYRRIPWIWRVAIAAGKSGDTDTIRSILIASLPAEGQRLEHWQSVVIGGGLINGISLSGPWPSEELTKIVGEDASLKTAWHRSLELATAMADDESVPTGTRYDALRMVALRDWAIAGPQLLRYLQKGVHNELQMGSISGLADVRQPEVAGHLINGYQHFSAHNRELVIKALIRSEDRCLALLQALADGKLAADVKQHASVRKLTEHESEAVRQAAQNVLK